MTKKILAIALSVLMIVSCMPFAFAVDAATGDFADAIAAAAAGSTVTLTEDVELNGTITIDKKVIIDLNGKTITTSTPDYSSPMFVVTADGDVEFKSTGTGSVSTSSSIAEISESNIKVSKPGRVVTTKRVLKNSGKVTFTKGIFEGDDVVAVMSGSTTIVAGAWVKGFDGAIFTNRDCTGATITLKTGAITATDNAPVMFNGTATCNSNTFNMTGGYLFASMVEDGVQKGYMAMGLYLPSNNTANISGGYIKAFDGAGIVVRGGQLNVTGGTIIATGDTSGKCGDALTYPTSNAIVVDAKAMYPAVDTMDINISKGTFKSDIAPIGYFNSDTVVAAEAVDVTGGSFEITTPIADLADLAGAVAGATTTTFKLADDIAIDTYVWIGKNITLDLNGKNITANANYAFAVASGKTFIVKDSAGKAAAVDADYNVTCNAGKILSNGTTIHNAGTFVLNSGIIASPDGAGCAAVYCASGSTTEVKGGWIHGGEDAIRVVSHDAIVKVSGGVLDSYDNAVILENGSNGYNNNTITVSGGTIIGRIKTAGYVACGIYHANACTLNITGGTIIAINGCGVLARAGALTISGNAVIKTTGTTTGKVGDSRVVVPCSAVVVDSHSNYPGASSEEIPFAVVINGGKFTSEADSVSLVQEDAASKLTINGGSFSAAAIFENDESIFVIPDGSGDSVKVTDNTIAVYKNSYGVWKTVDDASKGVTYAIQCASGTSTIYVLKDSLEENYDAWIRDGYTYTVDLQGHNVKNVYGSETAGTIKSAINLGSSSAPGHVNFVSATPATIEYTYGICLYYGASSLGIGENVTLKSDNSYAVYAVANAVGSSATIDGKVINEGGVALYVNGTLKNTATPATITVNGSVEGVDAGIYAAGYANYVINGSVTGNTGIYQKGGNLVVNDGAVVKGTGASGAIVPNGSGFTSTGAALVIEKVSGYAYGSTAINGGVFTSDSQVAVQTNANVEPFIGATAAKFSSNVSDLCVEGYKAEYGTDGLYAISEITPVEEEFEDANNGQSMTLDSEISYNAYIDLDTYFPTQEDKNQAVMKITHNVNSDLTTIPYFATEVISLGEGVEIDEIGHAYDGTYKFAFGVAPAQITEPITIELFADEDDAEPVYSETTSVYNLCREYILANEDADLVALSRAMIDYAKAAQSYFSYRNDVVVPNASENGFNNPAVTTLTSIPKPFDGKTNGTKIVNISLTIKSKPEINLHYANDLAILDCTGPNEDVAASLATVNSGAKVIKVSGIAPAEFNEAFNVYTSQSSLPVYMSAASAYNSVLTRSTDASLSAMVAALYFYSVAAETYFG